MVFENYDYGDDFRTIDGVLVSPDGERTAWFKDSEGNIIAIGSVWDSPRVPTSLPGGSRT